MNIRLSFLLINSGGLIGYHFKNISVYSIENESNNCLRQYSSNDSVYDYGCICFKFIIL